MPTLENPLNNSEQPAHSLRWRKSRACREDTCVEAARRQHTIAVRDSATPITGPVLDFTPSEWKTFLHKTNRGTYDL